MAERVSTPHKKVTLKPTYHVVNIVANADLNSYLDLYGLANMSHDIDYEPEQFPGAILKVYEPKAALLLFKNGKMICTGARTVSDVKKAIAEAVELIKKYKKNPRFK
jgi:transcription initiation factor TFIID TATA-box-binding protein